MRGRYWLAALVVVALSGAVGGWTASRTMESPRDVAARTKPPTATIITAEVQSIRIQRTVISRGRVGPVDSVRIGYGVLLGPDDGASGSGDGPGEGSDVLTDVLVARGDKVHQGQVLVEINGRPVIVLQGAKAAYRDIKPGMGGVDVDQLQRALITLGDYSGPVTGVLDGRTKAAVDRLYGAAGYTPATTDNGDGTDHAVIQADRAALSDATSALNEARAQRKSATVTLARELKAWKKAQRKDPASAGERPTYQGPSGADIAHAESALTAAQQTLDLDMAHRGTVVPRNEVVFVPRLPATVTRIAKGIGYAPGSPLFTLSPKALALTAEVASSQAGFLSVGSRADVDLPGGRVNGKVTSIRSSPTPGQRLIRISTPRPLPMALDGTDVKVTFVAASTVGKVLAVPQGAISSDPQGDLSVIVQAADRSLTRIPVTVGVTGSDVVEVRPSTPGALHAGDAVVVGG